MISANEELKPPADKSGDESDTTLSIVKGNPKIVKFDPRVEKCTDMSGYLIQAIEEDRLKKNTQKEEQLRKEEIDKIKSLNRKQYIPIACGFVTSLSSILITNYSLEKKITLHNEDLAQSLIYLLIASSYKIQQNIRSCFASKPNRNNALDIENGGNNPPSLMNVESSIISLDPASNEVSSETYPASPDDVAGDVAIEVSSAPFTPVVIGNTFGHNEIQAETRSQYEPAASHAPTIEETPPDNATITSPKETIEAKPISFKDFLIHQILNSTGALIGIAGYAVTKSLENNESKDNNWHFMIASATAISANLLTSAVIYKNVLKRGEHIPSSSPEAVGGSSGERIPSSSPEAVGGSSGEHIPSSSPEAVGGSSNDISR